MISYLFIYLTYWPEDVVCIQWNMSPLTFKNVVFYIQIPNGLEKYLAFFLNKNLVFIDSIQFMNSSLDKLFKILSDEDFKSLVEKFGSKNLELLKQKDAYPYEYMNSFEKFNEKKCLLENISLVQQKK